MAWAEDLIAELGKRAGTSLSLSKDGTCSLVFGQDEIDFELRDDRLFIMADLGTSLNLDQNFKEILKGCNIGVHTAFGSLGIDTVRDEFVLTRVLSAVVSYEVFEQILSAFVKVLRYWKRRLSKLSESSRISSEPSSYKRNYLNEIIP